MARTLPLLASCITTNWPTCGYNWSGVCKYPLRLSFSRGTTNGAYMAVSGGWITGSVGNGCAGSDPYVTYAQDAEDNFVYIDFYSALVDGAWSSSTVISVLGNNTTVATLAGTLQARPYPQFLPLGSVGASAVLYGGGCPTSIMATLTVYDDATLSLV